MPPRVTYCSEWFLAERRRLPIYCPTGHQPCRRTTFHAATIGHPARSRSSAITAEEAASHVPRAALRGAAKYPAMRPGLRYDLRRLDTREVRFEIAEQTCRPTCARRISEHHGRGRDLREHDSAFSAGRRQSCVALFAELRMPIRHHVTRCCATKTRSTARMRDFDPLRPVVVMAETRSEFLSMFISPAAKIDLSDGIPTCRRRPELFKDEFGVRETGVADVCLLSPTRASSIVARLDILRNIQRRLYRAGPDASKLLHEQGEAHRLAWRAGQRPGVQKHVVFFNPSSSWRN